MTTAIKPSVTQAIPPAALITSDAQALDVAEDLAVLFTRDAAAAHHPLRHRR